MNHVLIDAAIAILPAACVWMFGRMIWLYFNGPKQ